MLQDNLTDGEVRSDLMRMSLNVPHDIPEKLRDLAGGKFKMGTWITELIRQMHDNRLSIDVKTMDIEALRLLILGLSGQVQSVQGEMMRLQAQVAALIAREAK